jgi:hypothetical protein
MRLFRAFFPSAGSAGALPTEAEPTALLALPLVVAHRILLQLPADERARCAAVCRGWRVLLADPSLWTRLDLTVDGGFFRSLRDGVLRGAAARAGGALQTLDMRTELHRGEVYYINAALLAVIRANADTLQEVHMIRNPVRVEMLAPLLRAGPALRTLSAAAECVLEEASALLRNEPPYGALRLQKLEVWAADLGNTGKPLLGIAAALATHTSLRELKLIVAQLESAAICEALVDALVAAGVSSLALERCYLYAATASALARLLSSNTLTELRIDDCHGLLDDTASAAALAAALRGATTLKKLAFSGVPLWQAHAPGALLLGALAGHPSLEMLVCQRSAPVTEEAAAAAGAALGALLAADAPTLTELDVCGCHLGDTALGPLFVALPRNSHLSKLNCFGNDMSDAFAAERLVPAVRANSSLILLAATTQDFCSVAPAYREADWVLNDRCNSWLRARLTAAGNAEGLAALAAFTGGRARGAADDAGAVA